MVDTLPLKKRGHPLLLDSELDDKVKSYIKGARVAGTSIDATVVMASAEAIENTQEYIRKTILPLIQKMPRAKLASLSSSIGHL